VRKIDGDLVKISFREGCESCEKCGSCLTTSKPREFLVANPRGLPLIPGDQVEYAVSPGKAVKAAFMLLILPILLFFPFYYGVAALLPGAGEAPPVIAGLAGVSLGFLINILLRRGRRQYPEILRVIRP
jgi:positive regulator of sigma E activity